MYSYPSAAYVAQPPAITYGSGFHGRPSSRPPAGGRSQDNHHGHSHDENSHEHGHSPPNPSDSKGDHREHRYGRSQDHGHSHDSLSHDHFHEHPGKPSHGHAHEHSQSADSFPSTFTFPPSRKSNGYALPAARSHSHNDRFSSHLQSHSITIPEDTGPHSHSHSYSQPNGHSHSHSSSHSHSHSQIHHDDSILCTSPKKEPWTLSTISTPLLISLTYLLTEYASKHHHATHSSPPAADSPLDSVQSQRSSTTSTNLLSSFSLVAGILLLSSLYHRFKCIQQRDDSGGGANGRLGVDDKSRRFMPAKHRERVTIPKMAELGCGLLLPYFAALELGGVKTALFSLAALVGGVSGALRTRGGWRRLLGSQRGIAGILCTWIAWEGITAAEGGIHAVMIAYIALLASTLFFGSPFASPVIAPTAQEHDWRFKLSAATAGAMFIPPLFYWMFFVASLDPDPRGPVEAQSMFFWWWLLAVVVGWSGVTFANVKAGSIIGNVPFAIGAMAAIVGDLMLKVGEQSFWALGDKCVLVGAVLGGIYLDAISANSDHHEHDHSHDHHGHSNDHALASKKGMAPSHITRLLVSASQPVPLLHSILIDRNSRRIFYFMCLNFTFMIIQTVYGILTSSLGLLSDSIHMLFDCLALLLGLFAAVMSKYPPSARFPYGLGKMDTLAGFANGVFLMLISVEIVLEAIERLVEPVEMKRIGELLIVSSLGLAVNLVGIWAFDHAHHHPGHSHGHSHSHGDDGGHGHSENMHGIFLHILADTLGSVAVVISTLLVQHFGWPGFDPLASVFIAVMIFVSAIPLVLSSAGGLLLTLPSNTEYNLREILSGINGLRGVVGCCVPRFWTDEVVGEEADGTDADAGGEEKIKVRVMGVVHVQVAREVGDLDDVRVRVEKYLAEGLEKGGVGVDVLVQVERVGEGGGGAGCWCGGGGGAGGGGGSASSLGCQNGNGALMGGNGNNGSLDPAPIGLGLRGPVEGPDMDSKAK